VHTHAHTHTRTHTHLKAEDKAKQARGGVQLARLSFPPTIDVAEVANRIELACAEVYKP